MNNSFKIESHLTAYNENIVELNNYRNSLPMRSISSKERILTTMLSMQSNIKGIVTGYNILSPNKIYLKKDIALFDRVSDEENPMIKDTKLHVFTYLLENEDFI